MTNSKYKHLPEANTKSSPDNLEQETRKAIYEHRRLAGIADKAYTEWEKLNMVPHANDDMLAELQYRYLQAILTMRIQQDELNGMLNRLGYIPKNVA